MTSLRSGSAILACLCLAIAAPAQAQGRLGWGAEVNAFVGHQGEADLDNGGNVSSTRSFISVGGLYTFESGNAAGLSLGFGQQSYDFGGGAPMLWGDVHALSLSAPMRFELGGGTRIFVVPQLRRFYESGASASDSTTYGLFAGTSWRISDNLRIGPAFGAFSELEGDDMDVFPALIIDWDVADRWNLSTGGGVAATRGPGLRLSYAYSDALNFGLGVRIESGEFRLDESGLAPDGVGEDSSIPVVISMDYEPNPGFAFSGFVGAAFDGELKVEDSTGATVSRQSYDTAPIGGLSLRLRF